MAARSSSASTPLLMGGVCSTRRSMRESESALQPRWSGQTGFFEIWFLVVFAPAAQRAWWLRYTTFNPSDAAGGAARATLWAAAFAAEEPGLGMKRIGAGVPTPYRPGEPWIRIGEASLSAERATGAVAYGGHRIAWDFGIETAGGPAVSLPWLLEVLPAPTRVGAAAPEILCTGWVEVDGRRLRFHATGVHRRVIAEGWCDPRTLVGYVYRDPTGFDVYVAQSDVASCTVEVARRARRRAPWAVERRGGACGRDRVPRARADGRGTLHRLGRRGRRRECLIPSRRHLKRRSPA